ncbi:hypothetical protein [Sulfobacillus thermosulfidooxidans]|uniref:hypothetical protein n=1 Tax=Sulfobacillus thermosulfidooxidans TaxID=28034 RepID=UPI0006B4542D|nr:hypothetical protein [Sulfobacillus thermosulfidooxidans]
MAHRSRLTLYWEGPDAALGEWIATHIPPRQRSAWIKACIRRAIAEDSRAPGDLVARVTRLEEQMARLMRTDSSENGSANQWESDAMDAFLASWSPRSEDPTD